MPNITNKVPPRPRTQTGVGYALSRPAWSPRPSSHLKRSFSDLRSTFNTGHHGARGSEELSEFRCQRLASDRAVHRLSQVLSELHAIGRRLTDIGIVRSH